MGTEVLRPQNILVERIRAPPASFSRRKSYWNHHNSSYNYHAANSRSNRKPAARSERVDQRKRVGGSSQQQPVASVSKRSSSDDLKMTSSLVMEKVTILRRGESLDSKIKSQALKKEGDDLAVCGTKRLGQDPKMVPKQIRIADWKQGSGPAALLSDVYAGSAFAMSPSPSSLPLPSFSKKQLTAVVDDSATREIRRLLRLE